MQRYSRLESTEEKRNFRNAVILIALSVLAVIALIIYGIPAVGRVAGFVSGLRGGNSPINSNDKTPPAPPRFNSTVDYTNQQYVTISGSAEPGATLKLSFNGGVKESVIDKDGRFTFPDLGLKDGENSVSAVAVDGAGNISNKSVSRTIIYDIKPPELTLENPADGAKFYGSTQRQINIKGKSESGAAVTINDRVVTIDDEGNFNYPVTLNSGDNQFTVKVLDQAGNSTEKTITLNFSD